MASNITTTFSEKAARGFLTFRIGSSAPEIPKHTTDTSETAQGFAPQPTRRPMYHLSWLDPDFARYRRTAIVQAFWSLVFNLISLWGCGAILYGAFYHQNELGKLKIYVVDFDGDNLGREITNAFTASLTQPNHFKLEFNTSFKSNKQVQDSIYDEQAWGAVIVNSGATQNLRQALLTGNASYNPASAVEMVSEGARNPLTSNSHVVPGIEAILLPVLVNSSSYETSTFLSANVNNASGLQAALRCPQCLANGFSYTPNDLRPAYNAATFGAFLSGAIFLIVFTFAVSGTSQSIGMQLGEHLNIPSTIVFRIINPITAYFFISLSITGCQAAFGIPMTTPYGGRGFVILWMLNWLTVSAMGLALEAIWTIFGFVILNFFLNFWVIWNAGSASYSFDIMPGFFRYCYGFPVYHAIQGTLTIVYGSKSHLGLNFGVLIAWIIGSAVVLAISTYVRLNRNKQTGFHVLP